MWIYESISIIIAIASKELCRRITIIGGSGFVGTRVTTRILAAGHSVTIADKNDSGKYPQLRLYADVREPDTLEKALAGSGVVINLAAEHRGDATPKSLYDDVNVTGVENVCNACTKLGIKKIIFTSSVAVTGSRPSEPMRSAQSITLTTMDAPNGWRKKNTAHGFLLIRKIP